MTREYDTTTKFQHSGEKDHSPVIAVDEFDAAFAWCAKCGEKVTPINREKPVTSHIEYAGFTIRESRDGKFIVTENGANIMPGATYGRTEEEALQLVDVLLAVDRDGQKFWHLLRAIQRQERISAPKPVVHPTPMNTNRMQPTAWPNPFERTGDF
jgi:hypothetical protein